MVCLLVPIRTASVTVNLWLSGFSVREVKGDVRMKCKYCEKSFTKEIVSANF